MTKHIELKADSVAELFAMVKNSDMITIKDLGHAGKLVLDIYTDSPYDGKYVKIPEIEDKMT